MSDFNKVIKQYADFVVKEARDNLSKKGSTGKLSQSIGYRLLQNRDTSGRFDTGFKIQFEMEEYGPFQDKGVKGKKHDYSETMRANSPYKFGSGNYRGTWGQFKKGILKWAQMKGIRGRDKKGRFITNQSLAFLLARSIYNKGIRATMFFTKPFEKGIDKYGDEWAVNFLRDSTTKILEEKTQ